MPDYNVVVVTRYRLILHASMAEKVVLATRLIFLYLAQNVLISIETENRDFQHRTD